MCVCVCVSARAKKRSVQLSRVNLQKKSNGAPAEQRRLRMLGLTVGVVRGLGDHKSRVACPSIPWAIAALIAHRMTRMTRPYIAHLPLT